MMSIHLREYNATSSQAPKQVSDRQGHRTRPCRTSSRGPSRYAQGAGRNVPNRAWSTRVPANGGRKNGSVYGVVECNGYPSFSCELFARHIILAIIVRRSAFSIQAGHNCITRRSGC